MNYLRLTTVCVVLLTSCSECNLPYKNLWQIREKENVGDSCMYEAFNITPCNNQRTIIFIDTCDKFDRSRIVDESEINQYK